MLSSHINMTTNENVTIGARIDRIRKLTGERMGGTGYYQAACLAQTILHDTVGGCHPKGAIGSPFIIQLQQSSFLVYCFFLYIAD